MFQDLSLDTFHFPVAQKIVDFVICDRGKVRIENEEVCAQVVFN